MATRSQDQLVPLTSPPLKPTCDEGAKPELEADHDFDGTTLNESSNNTSIINMDGISTPAGDDTHAELPLTELRNQSQNLGPATAPGAAKDNGRIWSTLSFLSLSVACVSCFAMVMVILTKQKELCGSQLRYLPMAAAFLGTAVVHQLLQISLIELDYLGMSKTRRLFLGNTLAPWIGAALGLITVHVARSWCE